jgi:diguanylate cyclase (GGDEF)-like protein/PAS domain S-box-containing protein
MDSLENKYAKGSFDSVLAAVVVFSILIFFLFSYLIKVNSLIYERGKYDEAISQLPVYDESFNNFFLKSTVFNNYDEINKDVQSFEKVIELLKSEDTLDIFGDKYDYYLKNLQRDFEIKKEAIERFKSNNALLISSMHYLVELDKSITNKTLLENDEDIHRLNQTMLDIMTYYLNPSINLDSIRKNIKYFKDLSGKSKELEQFVLHASINIKNIENLAEIKNAKYNLESSINNLKRNMIKDFDKALYNSRIVVTILFVIAIVILSILFVLYKRSLKIKDDLVSFKTAVENSYNSIVITDLESNMVYVNERAIKETGYTKEELLGQNPRILKSGDKSEEFYRHMHERLDSGEKWEGEFINIRKDGSEYYEKASIMPIFEGNQIVNYLAIKMNITDYILQKQKVEHMAYHDALTDLPNRLKIENYLEREINLSAVTKKPIFLLFIDIDNFKTINDSLGHDIGDELIIECANILEELLEGEYMLARTGGDEFAIVSADENPIEGASELSKKILHAFQDPVETNMYKLNITVSIGISVFPDDSIDFRRLFKYADTAMYEAKENGRNNYQFYRKKLSTQMHQRLEIEQALKHALTNGEIYPVYQPKYNIETQEVVGLETLARWNSVELGNVTPDKFIPISERTGDILDIGLYIFKKACEDFQTIKNVYPKIEFISVNVSAVQLYNDEFLDDIAQIVKESSLEPGNIVLEITETHVMKNMEYSIATLNKLKEVGFSISIDDFGTGHSSLNYLKRFPIDELKIDKSFIDELPHDQNDIALTKTIISLSKNMGYKNVAEGIETKEQEKFLLENGCHIGQGFMFSKPRKKEDLLGFLKDLGA